jgi:Flp pilus assembly protein TadG
MATMKPRRVNLRTNNHQRGQSLVELAISFMFLLLLLSGIVDLGRVLFFTVSLRDAAEEGVNYGSLKPSKSTTTSDTSDIVNRAKTTLDPTAIVTVTYGLDGTKPAKYACTGDKITVVVTQPNILLTMPLIGGILGSQEITLTNRYSGIVLRPACP